MVKAEIPNEAVNLIGDGLLDINGVSEVLCLTPQAIRMSLHRADFPVAAIRIGSRLRWRVSDVRTYIANAGGEGGAR